MKNPIIHVLDLHFLGIDHAIAAFLVETSEGLALVETGPHTVFEPLKKSVSELGYELTDIRHVFLTHIHFDHAGAAWAFAEHGATIYVHPFGAPHLASPEKLTSSARRIYLDDMDRLWGEMRPIPTDRLRAVAHQEVIQVGDTAFVSHHTPGHASHHIAWQVGEVLFAGDVAGVKIGNGLVVPPCPPPDIHIEQWQSSIRLMRSLDIRALYLTHFGIIEEIETHLNNLEISLLDWANWMLPRYQAHENASAVTPIFQNYVEGQLRATGADDALVERYEAANPSWMSVAGLMRYWHKKLNP